MLFMFASTGMFCKNDYFETNFTAKEYLINNIGMPPLPF